MASKSLESLSKPFLQIKGEGTVSFYNGLSSHVQFTVTMLPNGKINGVLVFPSNHLELFEYMEKMKRFTLRGVDVEDEDGEVKFDCRI